MILSIKILLCILSKLFHNNLEIYLDSGAGEDRLTYDAGLSNNIWYHVTVTYDKDQSNETTLYINGSAVANWSDASSKLDQSTGSPVTIGDPTIFQHRLQG